MHDPALAELALLPGARVLVAEDHPLNRAVLKLLLEPLGVEVVTAGDGAEAVEAFAALLLTSFCWTCGRPSWTG